MYYKKIKDKYVYLSPVDLNDSSAILWKNREERYDFLKIPNTLGENHDMLTNLSNMDAYAILINDSNTLIGYCGVVNTNYFNRSSELFLVINPNINKEEQIFYGRKALNLYLDYCYKFLNLNSITCSCGSNNLVYNEIYSSLLSYIGKRNMGTKYKDKYYNTNYYHSTKYNRNINNNYILDNNSYINLDKNNKLSNLVEGEKIALLQPNNICFKNNDLEYISCFLNDRNTSYPLLEFITNYNRNNTLYFLSSSTYLIMKYNEIVGYISLINPDFINKTSDIAYAIFDKKNRNLGYMKETLDLFSKEIFRCNEILSLNAKVLPFNDKSSKTLESVGFNLWGVEDKSIYLEDNYLDAKLYEKVKRVRKNS